MAFAALGVMAVLVGCCLLPRREGLKQSAPPRGGLAALLLTVALFFALRLWDYLGTPGTVYIDEALAAYDSWCLSLSGRDHFGVWLPVQFEGWVYGQMSVLLSYVAAPLMKLWGLSKLAIRLPMLLFSTAAAAALWYWVRRAVGGRAALCVLFFVAISPWHVMQSRWAIDCNLFPHVFLLGLVLLYFGVKRRRWALYLSMAAFALCLYCYGIAYYFVPLFLLAAAVMLLRRRVLRLRQVLTAAGIFLIVALPVLTVIVVNAFGLPTVETPFFTASYFAESVRISDILFFSEDFWGQLLKNLKSVWEVGILQGYFQPVNHSVVPRYGVAFLCSLPLVGVGVCSLVRRRDLFSALVLRFALCAFSVGVVFNEVTVWRYNILWYAYLILAGVGLSVCVSARRRVAAALIAAVLLCETAGFAGYYFTRYNDDVQMYFYEGLSDAVAYPVREGIEFDRLYVTGGVNKNPRVPSIGEVLVWYYHRVDPRYLRGELTLYDGEGEALPPYDERFCYVHLDEIEIDPEEDAVYIANKKEVLRFSPEEFVIHRFRDQFCVVPKHLEEGDK